MNKKPALPNPLENDIDWSNVIGSCCCSSMLAYAVFVLGAFAVILVFVAYAVFQYAVG